MNERQRLIKTLAEFAGPLGPFVHIEDHEERRSAWQAALGPDSVPLLLTLLTDPPAPIEYGPAAGDAFEWEITEALLSAGQQDPAGLLQQVGPLLDNEHARPALIEVIGALGLRAGIIWLAPLVTDERLTTDEGVRLACALGELGGDAVRELLDRLRAHSIASDPRVTCEINIALLSLGSDSESDGKKL